MSGQKLDFKNEAILIDYLKNEKHFSEEDIAEWMNVYKSLSVSEMSDLIYELAGKSFYREKPVDMKTFIHDPYYLGAVFGDSLFPLWDQMLQEIYPAPFCKTCEEVVLSCGTRCFGKGTEILMYDGTTKKVEDIVVGDILVGDDNTPRTVLRLTSGEGELYKIIPQGDIANTIICNFNHEIPLFSLDGSYKIVKVEDLYNKRKLERFSTLEIPKYNYLKKVVSDDYEYRPFTICKYKVDKFYGFTIDGNNLFRLANGYIQKNCGKTYSTSISMLYEIYLLLCMTNPAQVLLGNPGETIVFAILSKDNSTAVSQGASLVFKGLSSSPYFQERVPSNLPLSNVEKKGVPVTDNILIKAGSSLATIIGANLYSGCLDEANMPTTKIAIEKLVDVRMQIYTEMLDRKRATFDKAPALSGIIWLTSSPTDEGDVVGARIKQVQEQDLPNVMIKDNIARWETRGTVATETFDFFLGSDTKDPCLLEDVPDLILTTEELETRVIKVPRTINYLNEFRNDPIHSIQNIAGRRTVAENSFFNSVGIFSEVFFKENHIFRADELNIPINTNMTLDDYLIDKDYFKHPDKPECYRYIHLDIASKKDRFGLASVYSDSVKYRSDEGEEITRRKYYIDFCLGVMSSGKDPVDILKVLEFVYGLKKLGYPIKVITTDNHQGELARQIISKRGIATEYLSVEKTKEPYYNLKNLILTKSLEGFVNPLLTRELHGLRESEKKIEKSKGYTDDLADALAGATFRCSQDKFYKKTDGDVKDLITNFKKAQRTMNGVNLNPYNDVNKFKLW